SPTAREQIVFWQLGSLNGARWQAVAVVTPFVVVGVVVSLLLARRLDLLALGERSARHLGVNVERLRLVAIVVIALLVGAGVACAGVIVFVGLVVPHLVRLVAGPGHRLLLPASALGGALLLAVADLVARTAVPFADLPLGMLTSIVGGPFFLWLMRRMRSRHGGGHEVLAPPPAAARARRARRRGALGHRGTRGPRRHHHPRGRRPHRPCRG